MSCGSTASNRNLTIDSLGPLPRKGSYPSLDRLGSNPGVVFNRHRSEKPSRGLTS